MKRDSIKQLQTNFLVNLNDIANYENNFMLKLMIGDKMGPESAHIKIGPKKSFEHAIYLHPSKNLALSIKIYDQLWSTCQILTEKFGIRCYSQYLSQKPKIIKIEKRGDF